MLTLKSLPIMLLALAAYTTPTPASIISVAGNDTLVANRSANLILNGSFEADAGFAANYSYWATGTTLSPTMSLTSWTASGQVGSYAIWGNDGLGGINGSASLPHGNNGLYFGAGIMAGVSPFPTEAADGQVSFSSSPTIIPKPTDGPVTLEQTVSGLNTSSTYLLDFWTSGEDVSSLQFPVDGFFGLKLGGRTVGVPGRPKRQRSGRRLPALSGLFQPRSFDDDIQVDQLGPLFRPERPFK